MKRILWGAVIAPVILAAGTVLAAPPEPVGISMLRIEMKKALMQQEAAPKMTELKQKKLDALRADKKDDEAADAEVDLIQTQTAKAVGDINVKELELQLKEALKSVNAPPSPAPTAPAPGAPNTAGQDQAEPPASPAEIEMMQFDLQKTRLQADAAAKTADNRQKLLAARQARQAAASQLADAEADVLATQTNARLMELEVEAAQMRLNAAVKSTKK